MRSELCNAVDNREILIFEYEGELRQVHPYKVGKSTAGNDILSGYLDSGVSKSEHDPYLRLYRLDKIQNLEKSGDSFNGVEREYKRTDDRMKEIYCSV